MSTITKTAEVRLYKPKSLDLSILGRYGERVVYLTHTLYVKRFLREESKRGLDQWEPLRSDYLANMIGYHHYGPVMGICLQHGIVERDQRRNYAAGRYPCHYRMGERFRGDRFELHPVRSRYLKANIARQKRALRAGVSLPYQHVIDWLDQLAIEEVPESAIWEAVNDRPRRNSDEPMNDDERFTFFQHQVENVKAKTIAPIVDEYGRLHSVLTNLKSSLRRYLRLNGKTLVSIDIKTSQPLFLGLFVQNHPSKPFHTTQTINTPPPIPLCIAVGCLLTEDVEISLRQRPPDLEQYFSEVQYRDLYAFLQKESGYENLTRQEFKHDRFFSMLYGKNKWEGRVYKAMRAHFPTVVRAMREVKGTDNPKADPDQFKHLAREMQKAEADFIFNRVIKRLMNEHPTIPVLTIHDSVLTTVGNQDVVEQVMKEEFAKMNVHPQLTREVLNHDVE